MESLRTETKSRSTQVRIYPILMEERVTLVIKGLKEDNSIEFLFNCEREMELIIKNVTDKERMEPG